MKRLQYNTDKKRHRICQKLKQKTTRISYMNKINYDQN